MKISSGEELVAEVVEKPASYEECWTLKAPRMLMMQPTGPGQFGIAIVPYSSGSPDGEHKVRDRHVISTCDAPDKLEKAYIENVSNIQIVSG